MFGVGLYGWSRRSVITTAGITSTWKYIKVLVLVTDDGADRAWLVSAALFSAARCVDQLFRLTRAGAAAWVILLYLLDIISGCLISTADGKPISVFGWFEIPAALTDAERAG